MFLLAWSVIGVQNADAQVNLAPGVAVKMPYVAADSVSACYKLTTCNDAGPTDQSARWTDDGTNDGNYADGHERRDSIEFCPEDKWHRVKIVFTAFDLEDGKDSLVAYNGTKALPKVRSGLGVAIVSTSQGVMTDRAARELGVGGEVLCTVF